MLVLAVSLGITYGLVRGARQDARRTVQLEFEYQARETGNRIVQRMQTYEQVLRGAAGLFASSVTVERDEFHAYVASLRLEDHYPGIQGVGYALLIPPAEKVRHVDTLRREGFPDYTLKPEGERETYTAIVYLEPFRDRNLRAFGYDMYSEPVRREAMERARDSGDSALSGKVTLVQETGEDVQTGFLMYLPVYRNGVSHETPEERSAQVLGWVYAPFRMRDLMAGILGDQEANFDLQIYDGAEMSEPALMFGAHESGRVAGEPPASLLQSTQHLEFGGRAWTVRVSARPVFEEARIGLDQRYLMVGGCVISVLLFFLTAILLRGRAQALSMSRELGESEARWNFALEGAGDGVWDWNVPAGEVFFSRRWKTMLGYAEDEIGNRLDEWESRVHPDDKARVKAEMQAYFDGKTPTYRSEHRVRCKDGSWRWILDRGMVVSRTQDGQPLRMVGTHSDISMRKEADEFLKLAASIYEFCSEAIMVSDADNHILAVNPAFTRITGYTAAEIIGKTPRVLSSGRQDEGFYQTLWDTLRINGQWQGELWNRRKNGEEYAEWLSINVIRDEAGAIDRYIAMFSDVTQKVEAAELIWNQANFDPLTHLPNRRLFRDRLTHAIRQAHRSGRSFGLLFLDLDHFKEVNDTLGHDAGDQLLIDVASRIGACVRDSDTVARLGGDEFTVILNDMQDPSDVEKVAGHIISALEEPFALGAELAYVSASIGITFYPDDALDPELLLRNADQAAYVAKAEGRNRYRCFTPTLQISANNRLSLINDLRGALTGKQFMLHFQPIVALGTGRICMAEALLRWHHPLRGMVSPLEFIPLAEETGMIGALGDWAFREAARWVRRWAPLLPEGFQVSVNMSSVQFREPSQPAWLDDWCSEGLGGCGLVIEITESVLLHSDARVTDKLLQFRDAGIQVAIDDFGTGFSALSYLKRFDIDYLKIDRSFIGNLAAGGDESDLCETIIAIARKLGLKVIAEGVETVEQRDLLASAGCDYGQGYWFAPPMPGEVFDEWLGRDGTQTPTFGRE